MNHGRALLIASLLLAGSVAPSSLAAQFPASVQPGTRVRVSVVEPFRQMDGPLHRQLLRGTVQSADAGALRLTIPGTTGTLDIARGSVRRLEISRGVSRPASMVERAVGGAIATAVTFALMNDPKRTGGPTYRTDWRAAGVGAAWGGGIGAVLGLVFPHESWRRVRM
ncbi:MAG: hypothetical protein ACJ79K_16070 [Gemmatimonadaceae bacterium]